LVATRCSYCFWQCERTWR